MTKKELRKKMSTLRNHLSQDEIQLLSDDIFRNLLKIPAFCECDKVLSYINIKSEVSTNKIIEFSKNNSKKTAAPKVIGNSMDFFYFNDDSDLSDENKFRIPEPVTTAKCIPDSNTVIIIPGLIFDASGARIGYGGGYYDRYLEKYHPLIKIAIAYDFQVIEQIDNCLMEATDIKPDYIVTDRRIIIIN